MNKIKEIMNNEKIAAGLQILEHVNKLMSTPKTTTEVSNTEIESLNKQVAHLSNEINELKGGKRTKKRNKKTIRKRTKKRKTKRKTKRNNTKRKRSNKYGKFSIRKKNKL